MDRKFIKNAFKTNLKLIGLPMLAYYPESKVELHGFLAKHYDALLTIITLGKYTSLIKKAIQLMKIKPDDRILDLGAGTGKNACLMKKYLSKDGELIGLDISSEMIEQFEKKCANFPNVKIINQRIDKPLPYENEFDKVFISFVLHGFPHEVRRQIVKNAFKALKKNGEFFILDYNEFSVKELPFWIKIPFKLIECPYAFDFVEKNWKKILSEEGFNNFEEHIFFNGFLRLLKGVKVI